MNCKKVQNKLAAFLGGQLNGEEAHGVRKHLASCTSCSSALSATDRIETLTVMDELVEPAPDLQERFRARLEAHRQSQAGSTRAGWWNWMWQPRRLAALGALAAVLIIGFYWITLEPGVGEIDLGLSEYEQLPLLQEMGIIQNLELLEDFDAIAVLSENGEPPTTIQ
jgi:predicted anti-sigma-YlaC factor YlaD